MFDDESYLNQKTPHALALRVANLMHIQYGSGWTFFCQLCID
jgi:hypothetical protein